MQTQQKLDAEGPQNRNDMSALELQTSTETLNLKPVRAGGLHALDRNQHSRLASRTVKGS